MTDENRKFSRIGFWGAGEIIVEGKTYAIEQVEDLSVGGCHFALESNFSKGVVCVIHMFLAEGQITVEAEGEIAWTDGKTIGISFTSIAPEDLQHLKNIIRYNAPDSEKVEQEMKNNPGIK